MVCWSNQSKFNCALLTELDHMCIDCFNDIKPIYDKFSTLLYERNLAIYTAIKKQTNDDIATYSFQFLPFVSFISMD
jgi:hypothetical protein